MEKEKILLLILKDTNNGIKEALSEYGNMVKAIAIRILPNRQQDIEECVADTFVSLWKNAEKLLHGQYPVKAWLAVTARNNAIDCYRRFRRTDALPLNEDIAIVAEDLSSSEAEDAIEELIYQLDFPDKDIFIRKYYLFESSKTIAQALNITEQNVNMRLSRGRDRLRKELKAMGLNENRRIEKNNRNKLVLEGGGKHGSVE